MGRQQKGRVAGLCCDRAHLKRVEPGRPSPGGVEPALRVVHPLGMASRGKSVGPIEAGSSTEGLQAMLDALPAMVGYWDHELRNRMANAAYIEFFGKSPEELRGTHIRDL